MDEYGVVFTSCKTQEEAKGIAEALLLEKLAACIQTETITSYYTWQEKLQEEKEVRLSIKTREVLYPQVETLIRKHHSYQVPEIIYMRIDHGSKEYLTWMNDVTKKYW